MKAKIPITYYAVLSVRKTMIFSGIEKIAPKYLKCHLPDHEFYIPVFSDLEKAKSVAGNAYEIIELETPASKIIEMK